jgi:SOS-response transcriptional repressor LexA
MRQAAVLRAVCDLTARQGYPPTFREVAREAGISLATARQKVAALKRLGVLQHDEGVCRSLRTKERN